MSWETVIGLEIHAQLATRSKIFSGAATAYGAEPNTQACLVDLGYPGVLPVLNAEVVRMALKFGLAIGASIAPRSVFARKNYFYPDLPKGYQISQYELPIVHDGRLAIELEDGSSTSVHIIRAHLEEDAGKSLHENFAGLTAIDLNRAGTPLIEIVSAPDMRSAKEAVAYMKKIHQLVRYLGICDGNMQEGSFRCDANVSVRRSGTDQLGTRTETKNLNSFRFLERAILYEVERQIEVLESGGKVIQETRLYDPDRDETRSMRSKEEANDYRYFPDPDLLPVLIGADFIAQVQAEMPELPDAKRARFVAEHGLGTADAALLAASIELAAWYEAVVMAAPGSAKLAANWINGELMAALNRDGLTIETSRISPAQLAGLLRRIMDDTISGKLAKQVFELLWSEGGDADTIIDRQGLRQITDSGAIEAVIDQVLAANPEQVAEFRAGKTKVIGFLVGQIMKASAGKANPAQVNELLKRKLQGLTSVGISMPELQTWTTERIVRLVALVLLALACLQIILPFLGALAWAAIIAITVWPAFVWLAAKLGARPVLAASICTFVLFVLLVLPFAVLTATLGQAVPQVGNLLKELTLSIGPEPPAWLSGLPFVGELIRDAWVAGVADASGLIRRTLPAAEEAGVWALAQGANLALVLLQFIFAILIAGVMLVTADRFAELAQRLVSRLQMDQGGPLIGIVVSTVRSVSIGLVGTASIQALVAALGFGLAGVPGIALLGFATFLLALIQLPTLLVWAPAAFWLYHTGETGHAIFLAVWGLLLVNSVDNFLRPYLISRGAKLPFALILMGVLGGLLAWGMVGLFIGPTLLAVAYSLVRTWIGVAQEAVAATPAPPQAKEP